jgi:hypothetical protein
MSQASNYRNGDIALDDPLLIKQKHLFKKFTPFTLLKAICTRDERFQLDVSSRPNGKIASITIHNTVIATCSVLKEKKPFLI